jgi:hypothetical protein
MRNASGMPVSYCQPKARDLRESTQRSRHFDSNADSSALM